MHKNKTEKVRYDCPEVGSPVTLTLKWALIGCDQATHTKRKLVHLDCGNKLNCKVTTTLTSGPSFDWSLCPAHKQRWE